MSDTATKRLLRVYQQSAEPTMFLTGFFQSPAENFYNSEKVEIDIERSEEEVSIAVQNLRVGYRENQEDLYTNKEFTPVVHRESGSLNAFDLLQRSAGNTAFDDPNFQAEATMRSFKLFRKMEAKIRRSIELQASQVLQTAQVDLKDGSGASIYSIDYKPKASHFPTAATSWATSTNKVSDVQVLADQIRTDGLRDPNILVFGDKAFAAWLADSQVQELLNNRRINVGEVRPESRGMGATYQGTIWIGNYNFEMWTYNGRYKDPQSKNSTKFMDDGKVVVLSSDARLDATFGAVPRIASPDSRALPYLPSRISTSGSRMDMFTNAWLSNDGEQLKVAVASRPLMIPTAIDTYGCLDTQL